MAAKHGGRRQGAGRKPGAATTRTRAAADRIAATSQAGAILSPLDVMLENMRFFHARGEEALAKLMAMPADAPQSERTDVYNDLMKLKGLANEAAKAAAPYAHPRLAAVQVSGGLTLTHEQALAALDG